MRANLNHINRYNQTPIMLAAYSGRFQTFELLLENGANPDLEYHRGILNFTTLSLAREFGSSFARRKEPFWWQDRKEKERIVEYLLK